MIPQAVDVVLSTKIALDRLKRYLNQPEVVVTKDDISDGMVAMDGATFTWPRADAKDAEESSYRLRRVTLSLPQGKLSLVCGPLGSGKTLFVSARTNTTDTSSGHFWEKPSWKQVTLLHLDHRQI